MQARLEDTRNAAGRQAKTVAITRRGDGRMEGPQPSSLIDNATGQAGTFTALLNLRNIQMSWNSNPDGSWPKDSNPTSDPRTWPKPNPTPFNPWDRMTQDELLVRHEQLKADLEKAKATEMELRKYIVKRAFPNPTEGVNTIELGNGYQLKAGVKYNYKLADNDTVERGLEKIVRIGNSGAFVADRLISWTPNFLLTEYRALQEQAAQGSVEAKAILNEVNSFLTITDAAPTLEIKAPKAKK